MKLSNIAIINSSGSKSPAPFCWYTPDDSSKNQSLPNVRDFFSNTLLPNNSATSDKRITRPLGRSVLRTQKLANFLGITQMKLGKTALYEFNASSPSASVSVFSPIEINGHSHNIFIKGIDDLPATISEYDTVKLIMGSCLFSGRALQMAGTAGTIDILSSERQISESVQRIIVDNKLTLYELETANRLTQLVADILTLIPENIQTTIIIDVPRIQYYSYVLDAFGQQLISPELVLQWFQLVDERNKKVTRLIMRCLTEYLSKRKMPRSPEIQLSSSMDSLEVIIKNSVIVGNHITIAHLCEILSKHDSLWKRVIDLSNPETYSELINLSYVVEQLRPSKLKAIEEKRLTIDIDNYGERRIYQKTQDLAKKIKQIDPNFTYTSLGLYPLESIFTSNETGVSDLYWNDPGHLFIDESGKKFTTSELLAQLK